MAYTPNTLSGAIVPDANGGSLFTYQTGDTMADVSASGYFGDASGVNANSAHKVLYARDIVMCQCSDGLQLLIVTSSNAIDVPITTSAKWVEA